MLERLEDLRELQDMMRKLLRFRTLDDSLSGTATVHSFACPRLHEIANWSMLRVSCSWLLPTNGQCRMQSVERALESWLGEAWLDLFWNMKMGLFQYQTLP